MTAQSGFSFFWFGRSGIETTEIVDGDTSGFYSLTSPVELKGGILRYAFVAPNPDGTCSLTLYAEAPGMSSRDYLKCYITLPDGNDYHPGRENIQAGGFGGGSVSRVCVIAFFKELRLDAGKSFDFILHLTGDETADQISLPAADSSIFENRLSSVSWNGIKISAITLGGDFNGVLVNHELDPDKCELPELKKILDLARDEKNKVRIKMLEHLCTSDGLGMSRSGMGRGGMHSWNYSLSIPYDPDKKPDHIKCDFIFLGLINPDSSEDFDGTLGIDLDKLAAECIEYGITTDFKSKSGESVPSGCTTIVLDLDNPIILPLK